MNELIVRTLNDGSVGGFDKGVLIFRWSDWIRASHILRDIEQTGCEVIYES